MSAGVDLEHGIAMKSARDLVELLAADCERIEIAGSLRRGKAIVHDIELVAIPKLEAQPEGLFGSVMANRLDEQIATMLDADHDLQARHVENRRADGSVDIQEKLGPAFKALVYCGIPVDLFIVNPPAQWGVIFALRTGPGAWNIALVTKCKEVGRRVAGGQVEGWVSASSKWEPMATPEERDFFAAIGQPWVEPADRDVDHVRITRPA